MLVTRVLLIVGLTTACAHDAGSRDVSHSLEFVASILVREWGALTTDTLEEIGPPFERVESRDGCDGAVFLQSVQREAAGPAETTVTLEVALTASRTPGTCLERLTVVTLSQRSDSAMTALRFAELVAERLQLDLDAEAVAVRKTLKDEGAFTWSVAGESNGSLRRRDLEVRQESGRWLTRFREFRDDAAETHPVR